MSKSVELSEEQARELQELASWRHLSEEQVLNAAFWYFSLMMARERERHSVAHGLAGSIWALSPRFSASALFSSWAKQPFRREAVDEWFAELSRHALIKKTPGVMGGDACIRDTRVAVWLLESLRRMGVPEADLLRKYPGLRAADLAAAWDYVDAFTDEIEAAIRAQDEADDEAV